MRIGSPAGAARRAPQLAIVALLALACGVATYWALQLFAPRTAIAPATSLVDVGRMPDLQRAAMLFGVPGGRGDEPAPAVATDITVLGVAASQMRASAVLAIDGATPRAYAPGDSIDARTRLVEVGPDAVVIDRGTGPMRLPAPPRPDPALLSAGPATSSVSAPAAPVRATPARVVPAPTPAARVPAMARPPGIRQ